MSKEYNPNSVSVPNGNYFAMPYSVDESALIIMSVPWDVTTSYKCGTSKAPDAIMDASVQLDYYDPHNPEGYKKGIATLEIDCTILDTSRKLREEAEKVIVHLESGGTIDEEYAKKKLRKINEASVQLNECVYAQTKEWLESGKKIALVGGEHSVPYGYIKAMGEHMGQIGILHIDAHCDLRNAYEGFEYSHASIMYNVLRDVPQVSSLVQVAVRDVCQEEVEITKNDPRIHCFSDTLLSENRAEGHPWKNQCEKIIASLPENVYVSFDIDGLSPENCPNTGTPVPGGLSYNEAVYLLASIVKSGRKIVGFDLCEVAPGKDDEWDANVGARILFKLCSLVLA